MISTVHPRGRGEHSPSITNPVSSHGSSPRARGTHSCAAVRVPHHRFIPAGAGNTGSQGAHMTSTAVHPRGRGEHVQYGRLSCYPDGSSPRARGTRFLSDPPRWRTRFIPAGAGNTRQAAHQQTQAPVHPRGRGEHLACPSSFGSRSGSSPRARGTHRGLVDGDEIDRFIPAGAGNTDLA